MLVAGIDLGGTRCKGALLEVPDGGPVVLVERFAPLDVSGATGDDALKAAHQMVANCRGAQAIGLAVPGLHDRGLVMSLPGKFPGLEGMDVRAHLLKATGLPTWSANDALAAATGESVAGAALGASTAVVVTIGTGIGTAVLHGGKPVGTGPLAGGVLGGQMPISEPTGPTDTSGKRGTFEARCRAERLLAEANDAGCRAATVTEVLDLALAGDVLARTGITAWQRWFLRGLLALAHAHAPEVLVVGGGPARSGSPLLDGLDEQLRAEAWSGYEPRLEPAMLGDDAGLIGMAHLASSELR